jgi:predicted TIM-barrel fold metal-dependent hydrolase
LTYISDPIGLNNIRLTGADHFLWSGDYPHDASTWPNSEARLLLDCADAGVEEADIRKLTCTNVAALYKFDLSEIATPSPRIKGVA